MRWRVGLYHLLLTAIIGGFAAMTVFCGRGAIEMPPPMGQPYAATNGAQDTHADETIQEAMRVVSPKTGDSIFMWEYIIPALAGIAVAVVEGLAARDRKREKAERERTDRRAEVRARESRLSMNLQYATLQLSIVSANALVGGHNNGNVERARAAAKEAQDEYEAFLHEITAKQMAKV